MNEFIEIITPSLITLLTAVLGYVSYVVSKFLKAQMEKTDIKSKLEQNKTIVDLAVKYVQQVYTELNGEEKATKAKEKALELMNEKGITISDDELDTILEAMVFNFKNGAK